MIQCFVVGNLGSDGLQKDVNGTTCVEFSIAHSYKVKGEKHTQWVRCSYFGKAAEAVCQYLKKGGTVACTGELTLREYTKKDGGSGSSLDMRVSSLQLCGGGAQTGSSKPAQSNGGGYGAGASEDDLPF